MACCPNGTLVPYLIKTIEGTEPDPTLFVGGHTRYHQLLSRSTKYKWRMWTKEVELVTVRIQLFARYGFPVYVCVAGERPQPVTTIAPDV